MKVQRLDHVVRVFLAKPAAHTKQVR